MSKPGSFKKYLLITRLLNETKLPPLSLAAIQAHLSSHGFSKISARTLQRDFQALREEFGINIQYSLTKRGYTIQTNTDEDISDFRQFLKLLELAERVETLSHTFRSTSEAARSIIFEHNDFFKGSEYLSLLADAIQRKVLLSFSYYAYHKEVPDTYTVEPYLVVEHRNRWYLMGWDEAAEKIKTFGLDRIQDIQLLHPYIGLGKEFDYQALFQNTFGITCLAEPPSRVVLSFTPKQGKYLKSLPLHHSQLILFDNEQEFRLELKVVLNIDLRMQLLSYGSQVEVLEPHRLRQEIAEELQQAVKKYL
jgi:predicted DNA-binding transcriptional regulator YafY